MTGKYVLFINYLTTLTFRIYLQRLPTGLSSLTHEMGKNYYQKKLKQEQQRRTIIFMLVRTVYP